MTRARIAGGEARGRTLVVPPDIRPSSAMTRRIMLDTLGDEIMDAGVLDLFAGAGVLSAEFLSRGARRVTAVEQSRKVAAIWRKNMALLGFMDRAEIMVLPVIRAVQRLLSRNYRFRIIVADPPYAAYGETTSWLNEGLVELAKPRGWIVIEHSKQYEVPVRPGLVVSWTKHTGDTGITAFRKQISFAGD